MLKNVLILLIALSSVQLSHGEDIDFSSIEDLSITHEEAKFKKPEFKEVNKKVYLISEFETLKIKLQDIQGSKLERRQIPRGAKLVRLFDGKVFYTQKDIIAMIHTKIDHEGFRYIRNKSGQIHFKILKSSTTSIKEVTKLYRTPKTFTRVPEKIVIDPDEKSINIDHDLYISFGWTNLGVSADIFDSKTTSASEFSLQNNFYIKKKKVISFGLNTDYNSVLINGDNVNSSIRSISLGPIIKWNITDMPISLSIAGKMSLYSSIASDDQELSHLSLGKNIFEASAFLTKKSKVLGKLLYGISYKRVWLKINSNQSGYIQDSSNTHDDTIAFHIGRKMDWTW